MKQLDNRIDQYILRAEEFAVPILIHLRETVHIACPGVQETMKWSFPHFQYKDSILCSMASFKRHCAFGFWNAAAMEDDMKILEKGERTAMGHLGKIQSIGQLPDQDILIAYIIKAMELIEKGVKIAKPIKEKQNTVDFIFPEELTEAIDADPEVKEQFRNFSSSKQKEYAAWINEAKTESTKVKRLATALEWIREGKSRNWKYEKQRS